MQSEEFAHRSKDIDLFSDEAGPPEQCLRISVKTGVELIGIESRAERDLTHLLDCDPSWLLDDGVSGRVSHRSGPLSIPDKHLFDDGYRAGACDAAPKLVVHRIRE